MKIYTPLHGVKRTVFRLPGFGGAALFLLPIAAPGSPDTSEVLVGNYDIGLLSPDRRVDYLARTASPTFISDLADYLWAAGSEIHPEKIVPDFQDTELGLGIGVVSSTDFVLELQITVVKDLGDIPLEFDLLNFETSRVAVLAMTRSLRTFDGDFSDDFDDEESPE